MNYGDILVGLIAIAFSVISLAISLGPWTRPYQLRSISWIDGHFGRIAARLVWMLIGIAAFIAGIAIMNGIRPAYAQPIHAGRLIVNSRAIS